MPAIVKPLLGLALLFGRLQAETPYETLCSSPPSQPDELEPGVTATYQCGHAFYTDDWTGKSSFAGTPKSCALQCAQWSSEGRCGWQNNACYQYKTGKDSAARLGGVAIYIKKTSSPVPVPDCSAIDEECKRNVAAKEDMIMSMQADLTTKQTIITTLGNEKGNCEKLLSWKETDITRLQGEKKQLQNWLEHAAPKIGPGAKPCPEDFLSKWRFKSPDFAAEDKCIFMSNGKFFKFFHQRLGSKDWALSTIKGSNLEACAAACAEESTCQQFLVDVVSSCFRHTSQGGSEVSTEPSSFDSFHLLN